MEPLSATWSFIRPWEVADTRRCPLVLDALHALQCWRVGHPGRMFRFVRSSPFFSTDRLSARLLYLSDDELADGELTHWCVEHKVQALTDTSAAREHGTRGYGQPTRSLRAVAIIKAAPVLG